MFFSVNRLSVSIQSMFFLPSVPTYEYMWPFRIENRKCKPRKFSLIRLPFAHHANESFSLSFCWQKNKWKLSVCLRTKRTCQFLVILLRVGHEMFCYTNSRWRCIFYLIVNYPLIILQRTQEASVDQIFVRCTYMNCTVKNKYTIVRRHFVKSAFLCVSLQRESHCLMKLLTEIQ